MCKLRATEMTSLFVQIYLFIICFLRVSRLLGTSLEKLKQNYTIINTLIYNNINRVGKLYTAI